MAYIGRGGCFDVGVVASLPYGFARKRGGKLFADDSFDVINDRLFPAGQWGGGGKIANDLDYNVEQLGWLVAMHKVERRKQEAQFAVEARAVGFVGHV